MLGAYFTRDFQRPWSPGAGYGLSFRERGELRGAVLKAAKMDVREEQSISYLGHTVSFHVLSPTWVSIGLLRCERSLVFTVTLDHVCCGSSCTTDRQR